MGSEPLGAVLCQKAIIADFLDVINSGKDCLTEFALAEPGTSRFNRAMYFDSVSEPGLMKLAASAANVSFLNGLCRERVQPAAMNSISGRKGADRHVKFKNIVSFDLDFKNNTANYNPAMRQDLITSLHSTLLSTFADCQIPIWLLVFSGNGIHVHFKLAQPQELAPSSSYKGIYDAIRGHLESISGLKFDPACSNPARLMRLPFSTNWKNTNDPVPCQILQHNPHADFSPIFECFKGCASGNNMSDKVDKQDILAKLDLLKILNHYRYQKHSTVKTNARYVLCSSPFSEDSSPSFHYDPVRKLYYDFSCGNGGDLFNLVAKFENIDIKSNFQKILHLAGAIAGIKVQENATFPMQNRISSRPKSAFELVSVGALLQEPPEAIEWLVEDLLPLGGTSLLCGKPKVGKTTLARLLAFCIASGQTFLERHVTKGKVIYLALEEKRSQVRQHFEDMGAKGDEDIFIHASAAPLERTLEQLAALVGEHRPALVIVDTLFRLIRIRDVCDYAAINNALEPLSIIARDTNAHFLLVHHMGKLERDLPTFSWTSS